MTMIDDYQPHCYQGADVRLSKQKGLLVGHCHRKAREHRVFVVQSGMDGSGLVCTLWLFAAS